MTPEVVAALVNLGSAGAVIAVVLIYNKTTKERDAEWRDFFTVLSSTNREDIADMRTTANKLTSLLEDLLKSYNAHDTQAKNIAATIAEIRLELARLVPKPRSNRT